MKFVIQDVDKQTDTSSRKVIHTHAVDDVTTPLKKVT